MLRNPTIFPPNFHGILPVSLWILHETTRSWGVPHGISQSNPPWNHRPWGCRGASGSPMHHPGAPRRSRCSSRRTAPAAPGPVRGPACPAAVFFGGRFMEITLHSLYVHCIYMYIYIYRNMYISIYTHNMYIYIYEYWILCLHMQ